MISLSVLPGSAVLSFFSPESRLLFSELPSLFNQAEESCLLKAELMWLIKKKIMFPPCLESCSLFEGLPSPLFMTSLLPSVCFINRCLKEKFSFPFLFFLKQSLPESSWNCWDLEWKFFSPRLTCCTGFFTQPYWRFLFLFAGGSVALKCHVLPSAGDWGQIWWFVCASCT